MLNFAFFSAFLVSSFAELSEFETTDVPDHKRPLKCCPKKEEPGYGDNPMCEEQEYECCGLTREWVCSEGDGKNFPCVYEHLDFSQGPFGTACRGHDDDSNGDDRKFFCCDPEDEPGYGDNPICSEGHRCCKLTGEWTCSTGDAKTFPCFLGKLDYSEGPFGKACRGYGGSPDRTSMQNTREPRDDEEKDRRFRDDSFDHNNENSCIRKFGRCYTSCSRAARVKNRGKLRSRKRCQRGVKACVSKCTNSLNECIDLHSKCDDRDDRWDDDDMNTSEPMDDDMTTREPKDDRNNRKGRDDRKGI